LLPQAALLPEKAQQWPSSAFECIGHAIHQRQLWSYNGQIRSMLFRERHDGMNIASVHGHARSLRRDAAVAGGAPDFFHARALL